MEIPQRIRPNLSKIEAAFSNSIPEKISSEFMKKDICRLPAYSKMWKMKSICFTPGGWLCKGEFCILLCRSSFSKLSKLVWIDVKTKRSRIWIYRMNHWLIAEVRILIKSDWLIGCCEKNSPLGFYEFEIVLIYNRVNRSPEVIQCGRRLELELQKEESIVNVPSHWFLHTITNSPKMNKIQSSCINLYLG